MGRPRQLGFSPFPVMARRVASLSLATTSLLLIHCSEYSPPPLSPPLGYGPFTELTAGDSFTCGSVEDGSVQCWGAAVPGYRWEDGVPKYREAAVYESDGFVHIDAGFALLCGIDYDSRPVCWGNSSLGAPSASSLLQLDVGSNLGCGLLPDSTLHCWTPSDDDFLEHFEDLFSHLAVGSGRYGCGLTTEGLVTCWSTPGYWEFEEPPPTGIFHDVAVGSHHACVLDAEGTAICWPLALSTADPPENHSFSKIAAYKHRTCGLDHHGEITCWNDGFYGGECEDAAPDGSYVDVVVGECHVCGLESDGTVRCFGSWPQHNAI